MSANLSLIGSRVKEFRRKRSFTQEELAELTNLTVQHIGNIETGKKAPSISSIIRIANALGITVDPLLFGNLNSEISAYVFEFAGLIINCNPDERNAILETLIVTKATLHREE